MRVDILYVPGCPHLSAARSRVREALRGAGVDAVVEEVEVATQEDAERLGMHGSPTLLVNGHDPFASEDEASVACRLYRNATGVEGAPSVAELVEVLSR